nr:hypothetical protein [uncultured Cetobacterium sp.]
MKKILVIGVLVIVSSLTFADDKCEEMNDILENRLEITFENSLGKDADIDIAMYENYADVEIEYDGKEIPKKVNAEKVSQEIAKFIEGNSKATDVSVTFKVDPLFGDEKIVYTKSFNK